MAVRGAGQGVLPGQGPRAAPARPGDPPAWLRPRMAGAGRTQRRRPRRRPPSAPTGKGGRPRALSISAPSPLALRHPLHPHLTREEPPLLQPIDSRQSRPPVEIHYLHEPEPARLPASVLALETLGRMHPATAITMVLTIAGMTAGTVVIAGLGLAIAAIVLGGRAPSSR